ncbi:MAG: DUF7467 domain-containing protein, partial [Prochlorotrichaceae cyanobacterium]
FSGGDGKLIDGGTLNANAATLLYDFDSTLETNLNQAGYTGFIVNSPLNDPKWNNVNGYSFTVKKEAFGSAGFGGVTIFDQHNSPAKTGGSNSYIPEVVGGVSTNTAIVTATLNGNTVVAVDDASVEIKEAGSTPNGTTVTGANLYELFGKPTSMTFTYIGGSLVSTGGKDSDGNGFGDQDGKAKLDKGAPDNDSTAYIVVSQTDNVSDIKDGSKKVYFAGTIQIGQSFTASLGFLNEDKFENDTRILIFEDENAFIAGANPLQVSVYKTDGSQPITLGDKVAGFELVEYQGQTGHYENPNIDSTTGQIGTGFSVVGLYGDALGLTFRYDSTLAIRTGGKDKDLNGFGDQDGNARILGNRLLDDDLLTGGSSFIRVSDKSNPNDLGGKEYFEGVVKFGAEFTASVFASTANTSKFGSTTYIHFFDDLGGTYLGSAQYKTDGSQPVQLGD